MPRLFPQLGSGYGFYSSVIAAPLRSAASSLWGIRSIPYAVSVYTNKIPPLDFKEGILYF
ncbi:hypothetical protein RIA_1272 [Riemerella anatipestifer RA-GD]|nr:hypothetical protein RIA_1272 [Riemerella anatipestifer RA-GD]